MVERGVVVNASSHPSKLALDRVALGLDDEAVLTHLKTCSACSRHLEKLKHPVSAPTFVHPSRLTLHRLALGIEDFESRTHVDGCVACAQLVQSAQTVLPVPNWVSELTQRRNPFRRWLPIAVAASLMSIAAASVFVRSERSPYVGDKGSAAVDVTVWRKRGDEVALWDGTALRTNDAFRFQIHPGRFTHLTVLELKEGALYRVLHSAPVSNEGLSPAWSVDPEGASEEVLVLLSLAPLSDEELHRAVAGESGAWVRRWSFPKEIE
jgi:hypothetical protein